MSAPFESPSGKSTKGRSVSDKKVSVMMEKSGAAQEKEDAQSWLSEVTTAMKNDVSLLKEVRALIKKKQKSSVAEHLRRGVRELKDVPMYVVHKALAKMTGKDESIFANLWDDDCRWLFYMALNGHASYRLPALKMSMEAFLDWCVERYNQQGRRLAGDLPIVEHEINWAKSVGQYGFVVADDAGPDTVIKEIYNRITKASKRLPKRCRMTVKEAFTEWEIKDSYHGQTARLVEVKTMVATPIPTMFGLAVIEVGWVV